MEREEYFYNVWNLLKMAAIILYLIGFLTRFIGTEMVFTISK